MDKVVTVLARRWFDKKNGNTYHSVKVYYDGHLVNTDIGLLTKIIYGYGSAWEQTALKVLYDQDVYKPLVVGSFQVNNTTVSNYSTSLRRVVVEQNGDRLVYDVVDVNSKKQLYFLVV